MPDHVRSAMESLEAPTMVKVGGASPVMAIVEHLSSGECRMRSINAFEAGERIQFTVALHGSQPIACYGVVASRTRNVPRYNYVISLETMPDEASAIARAIDKARAHTAKPLPDPHTGNGLTRASVRIPVDFEIGYTHAGSTRRFARATNISVGGVLMNGTDDLGVGASIELEIPLGGDRVKLHGRVVAHQPMTPHYNVAFHDVPPDVRDRIARFVEAHAAAHAS